MKKIFFIVLLLFGFIFYLSSCKIADISSKNNLPITESEKVATQKLDEVIAAQGFSVMKEKNLYSFTATDHWSGFMGKMAKIWPDNETKFMFKHNFNTFDGNALFLNGEREGDLIGVQSWNYYEKDADKFKNLDTGEELNPFEFGVVVFHYFLELPYRLKSAPIKRYYGKKKLRGQTYDLVFASWKSEIANEDFDQYILWINSSTKLVDYCVYTLRDNKNPLTKHKYGSIAFLEYKDVEGFKIPMKMPVRLDNGILKKKTLDKYFHQLTIHEFSFGGYYEAELYPLPNLSKKIDTK